MKEVRKKIRRSFKWIRKNVFTKKVALWVLGVILILAMIVSTVLPYLAYIGA